MDNLTAPPQRKLSDYEHLDWKKRDADLARLVGVTRERIRQVRKKLKIPKRKPDCFKLKKRDYGRRTAEYVCVTILGRALTDQNLEATRSLCSHARFKLKRPPRPDPWWKECKVNWDLPNRVLANIWCVSDQTIAQARSDYKLGPQRWDGRGHKHHEDWKYSRARDKEMAKAAEWSA